MLRLEDIKTEINEIEEKIDNERYDHLSYYEVIRLEIELIKLKLEIDRKENERNSK